MSKAYSIVTSYEFVNIENPNDLREKLKFICDENSIKGTILVASEGVNFTIAGKYENLEKCLQNMREIECLQNLQYKNHTTADFIPFKKMKVRLKKEIVALKDAELNMFETPVGHYLNADEWDDLISQDDVILIDTRNSYEIAYGTFKNAIDPETQSFSLLPEWFERNVDMQNKNQKIAMFCTGGIRCEKSTAYVRSLGFENVYHLKGGVLKYFEDTKHRENLWDGHLFIFDDRIALDKNLESIHQPSNG